MATKERLVTNSFQKKKNVTPNASTSGIKSTKIEQGANPCVIEDTEDKDMKLLREFDLQWEYGPCKGILRIERWNRADKHGLNPSPKVKDLLALHPNDEKYSQCLWNDYKNIM